MILDDTNPLNYKLVCYEGDSSEPLVTAVYKLENYDYKYSWWWNWYNKIYYWKRGNEKQTCAILQNILYCMEHYSESTEARVGNLLNSHEKVIKIDKMLESNPTE